MSLVMSLIPFWSFFSVINYFRAILQEMSTAAFRRFCVAACPSQRIRCSMSVAIYHEENMMKAAGKMPAAGAAAVTAPNKALQNAVFAHRLSPVRRGKGFGIHSA
jgi:hypothetical protein